MLEGPLQGDKRGSRGKDLQRLQDLRHCATHAHHRDRLCSLRPLPIPAYASAAAGIAISNSLGVLEGLLQGNGADRQGLASFSSAFKTCATTSPTLYPARGLAAITSLFC